jgi:hypothetical protein
MFSLAPCSRIETYVKNRNINGASLHDDVQGRTHLGWAWGREERRVRGELYFSSHTKVCSPHVGQQ